MAHTDAASEAADKIRIRRLARVGGGVTFLVVLVAGLLGYIVFYTNLFAYQPVGRIVRPSVPLAFTRPGRLRALAVTEGQRVAEGEILARLSDTTLRAQIAQAEAALDAARANLAAYVEELRMRESDLQRAFSDKLVDMQIDEDTRNIDIRVAQANLARMKILLEGAQKAFRRQDFLYQEGSTTERDLDDARTLYESYEREIAGTEEAIAQRVNSITNAAARREEWEKRRFQLDSAIVTQPYVARVREAEVALENLHEELRAIRLEAPENGVVVRVAPEQAQVLDAGQPFATLLTDRPSYIETYVEEYYLDRYPMGGEVWLETLETEIEFTGTIIYLGPEMVQIPENLLPASGGYSQYGRRVRIALPETLPEGVEPLPGLPLLVTSKKRWPFY